jgi:hypothetical protein
MILNFKLCIDLVEKYHLSEAVVIVGSLDLNSFEISLDQRSMLQ